MVTFEDLPLEVRSMILKECLNDILGRHNKQSMTADFRWYDDPGRWSFIYADKPSSFERVRRKLVRRREAAALEIQNLMSSFEIDSSSKHEFQRLVGIELKKVRDEGDAIYAQVEALGEAYRSAIGVFKGRPWRTYGPCRGGEYRGGGRCGGGSIRGRSDYHSEESRRRRQAWYDNRQREIKQDQYEQQLSVLEWSCNFLEMGLDVEERQWTKFGVHDLDCKRGETCDCPLARGMMGAYKIEVAEWY